MQNPPFLVQLRNAAVQRGGRLALHVPHFDLLPGEHWGIIGGNGAGKSTFLALLRGELWPLAPSSALQPPRLYGFCQPPTVSPLAARKRMPMVAAETQLAYRQRGWRITALEAVMAGMFDANLLYGAAEPHHESHAKKCLQRMDAASLADRLLPGLSQGELRRVLVARALAACGEPPAVLLLDEVCDGLDTAARNHLLGILEEIIRQDSGIQLMCASHRQEELPTGLTRTAHFHQGRLLSQSDAAPAVMSSSPLASPDASRSSLDAMLQELRPSGPSHQPLLELRRVDVYRDGAAILNDITWRMRQGEHWAIIGGNGAGKSTLLALICGELHPACVRGPAGSVTRYFDQPHLTSLRRRIGLVAPHLEAAWGYEATALELAASGLDARIGMHGLRPTAEQLALAKRWLEAFGVKELEERPFWQLSTGQRRRCFLARAMLAGGGGGPALLALDEPCSGLDAAGRAELRHLLEHVAAAGVPLVVASHHLDELPEAVTHFLLLRRGCVVATGPRQEMAAALESQKEGA